MQSPYGTRGVCAFCLTDTEFSHLWEKDKEIELYLCANSRYCKTVSSWLTFVDGDLSDYQLPAAWDVSAWGFTIDEAEREEALMVMNAMFDLSNNC